MISSFVKRCAIYSPITVKEAIRPIAGVCVRDSSGTAAQDCFCQFSIQALTIAAVYGETVKPEPHIARMGQSHQNRAHSSPLQSPDRPDGIHDYAVQPLPLSREPSDL